MSNQSSLPNATGAAKTGQDYAPSTFAHCHSPRPCHIGPAADSRASATDEHAMALEDPATTSARLFTGTASEKRASTPYHPAGGIHTSTPDTFGGPDTVNGNDSVGRPDALLADVAAESTDAPNPGQDNTADTPETTNTTAPDNDNIEDIIETSYRNAMDKTGAAHGNSGGGPTIMNETVAELGSAEGANLQFKCRFFPGRKGRSENNVRANRDAIVGLESHFNKPFSEILGASNMTPRHALCFPVNVIPKLFELIQVRELDSVNSLHGLLTSQQDVRRGKGVLGSRRNVSVKDLQDLIDATAPQSEPDTDQGGVATNVEHTTAPTTAALEPESGFAGYTRAPPDSPTQEQNQPTPEPESPIYEPKSPNYNPHSPSHIPAPLNHTSDYAPQTSSTSLRRARSRSSTPSVDTRPSKAPKTADSTEEAHETIPGGEVDARGDEDEPRGTEDGPHGGNDDHRGGEDGTRGTEDGPPCGEADSHQGRTGDMARLREEMEGLYRQKTDALEMVKMVAKEICSRDKKSYEREKGHGRWQKERAERAEERFEAEKQRAERTERRSGAEKERADEAEQCAREEKSRADTAEQCAKREEDRADRERLLAIIEQHHANYEERRADEAEKLANEEKQRADKAARVGKEGTEWLRKAGLVQKRRAEEYEQRAGEEKERADKAEQRIKELERELEQRDQVGPETTHADSAEQQTSEVDIPRAEQASEERPAAEDRQSGLLERIAELEKKAVEHRAYFDILFEEFKEFRERHGEI